jgi:hypothetical protein
MADDNDQAGVGEEDYGRRRSRSSPREAGGQELLQRRALHRAAREAAVVIVIAQQSPAFMGLALHIGFGSFAFCIERIELPFHP